MEGHGNQMNISGSHGREGAAVGEVQRPMHERHDDHAAVQHSDQVHHQYRRLPRDILDYRVVFRQQESHRILHSPQLLVVVQLRRQNSKNILSLTFSTEGGLTCRYTDPECDIFKTLPVSNFRVNL